MRLKISAALLVVQFCTGCTTTALEHYSLAQIRSVGDLRDREVLYCLAQVAADPDALPSFAISSDGTTRITDSVTLSGITTWTRAINGFATQTFTGNANRSPMGTWTVDTVGDFERLEAMRCACLWAVRGPECGVDCEILEDPQKHPNGKPHFGVAERLARLPVGWVKVGCLNDVPAGAYRKAHCGKTWAWVMPEDAEAFAQFELAMFDIALIDSQTLYFPRLLVTLVRDDFTKVKDVTDPTKEQAISIQEVRAVKVEYRGRVEEALRAALRDGKPPLTYAQWLEYTEPYHNPRTTQQTVAVAVPAGAGLSVQPGTAAPSRTLDRTNRSFRIP